MFSCLVFQLLVTGSYLSIQLLESQVAYDCHSITSAELLETAVKFSSYPPAIRCVVTFRAELRRTGQRTWVRLDISGVDPEMEFQCKAYEQIQGDYQLLNVHTWQLAQ